MVFDFICGNEEQRKECANIVFAELKKNFEDDEYDNFMENISIRSVHVQINNRAYFKNLENSKIMLYDEIRKKGGSIYLKDFISEVLENLSFVPRIIVNWQKQKVWYNIIIRS